MLADQLSKVRVNFTGLQEVRWADSGEPNLEDYTLLWSGPSTDSPRQAGVALAIWIDGLKRLHFMESD